jgi:hypothetical protein
MSVASAAVQIDQIQDTHRLITARRIFQVAVGVNAALTVFVIVAAMRGITNSIVGSIALDAEMVKRVAFGVILFTVVWGCVWFGIKNLLLAKFAGFDRSERHAAFRSRMSQPFSVAELVARHSERKIRISDMIGRRGRFMTIGFAGFFYLYAQVAKDHQDTFATAFVSQSLLDAVVSNWLFIAFFYVDHWSAALLYGAQTRVMDGVLARANCLLIVMLWSLFKFILVPIGSQLAHIYSPAQFATVFALIWGSYMVTDTFSEVGGSLYGRQSIRVWGIGDVNRKSVGGTLTGFVCGLAFGLILVFTNHLSAAWVVLAIVIAVSNTLFELFSPRGTDDFTMATANALICWAFGAWWVA